VPTRERKRETDGYTQDIEIAKRKENGKKY
jgi:hypothetical protein